MAGQALKEGEGGDNSCLLTLPGGLMPWTMLTSMLDIVRDHFL